MLILLALLGGLQALLDLVVPHAELLPELGQLALHCQTHSIWDDLPFRICQSGLRRQPHPLRFAREGRLEQLDGIFVELGHQRRHAGHLQQGLPLLL